MAGSLPHRGDRLSARPSAGPDHGAWGPRLLSPSCSEGPPPGRNCFRQQRGPLAVTVSPPQAGAIVTNGRVGKRDRVREVLSPGSPRLAPAAAFVFDS